jgi:hypothetical protein
MLLAWGVALALTACSDAGGSSDSRESGPVSPTAPPPTATTAGPDAAVATQLRAVAGCEGSGLNNHVADFSWRPAEPPGDGQRLVLSYVPGGLETDAFLRTGTLPADQSSYHWTQMNPGTGPRTWRVLTKRGDTWVRSETATFHGVDCPDG